MPEPGKKILIPLLPLIVIFLFFQPCHLAFGGYKDATHIWKVGSIVPRGMGWSKQMESIVIPRIYEATQGDLYFKIYWGGIKGDNQDMVRQMDSGELDAAGFDGQGAVLAVKEFAVLELPFLFRNSAEVDYIRKKMFPVFSQYTEKNDFKLFMWVDQDFDQVYSSKIKLSGPADFRQATFINWNGILGEKMFRNLGARAIPMEISKINSALKNKEADACIMPAMWAVGTQAHSIFRYVNPIKIQYSPAVLLNTMDAWNQIPEPYRNSMIAIRDEFSEKFITTTRKDNDRALRAMLEYGIGLVETNTRDLEALKRATRPEWDEMAGTLYSRQLLDQIQAHLSDFRKRKGEEIRP